VYIYIYIYIYMCVCVCVCVNIMALIGAGIKMFNISDISAQLIFMKWNLFLLYVFLSVLLHEYQERTLLL